MTTNAANPFLMGSMFGGYGYPAYGIPVMGGYPFWGSGYRYYPNKLGPPRNSVWNPRTSASPAVKASKKIKGLDETMLVVNPVAPAPGRPRMTCAEFCSHVSPGMDFFRCYWKCQAGEKLAAKRGVRPPPPPPPPPPPLVPGRDTRRSPGRALGIAQRPGSPIPYVPPGSADQCATACNEIYPHPHQFPEWDKCVDRCHEFWFGSPGRWPGAGRPGGKRAVRAATRARNPGVPTHLATATPPAVAPAVKLGGRALRARTLYVSQLISNMAKRDNAAVRDPRTKLVIRALKTAKTSQERREAITLARSLVMDWDMYDGSQRFRGPGAALVSAVGDDELRIVAQPQGGMRPRVMVCGRNNCCVIERPGDLWRCIKRIRASKKTKPNPSIARNPTGLCQCYGPGGTDCKCTICWEKKGEKYPSCITFPIPDQPASGPTQPTLQAPTWYPAQHRHARQAQIRQIMTPQRAMPPGPIPPSTIPIPTKPPQ